MAIPERPQPIATQGNRYSYHALAAERAVCAPINAIDMPTFKEVVMASLATYPGLGAIAINTAAGTVEKSAKVMFGRRTATLPQIVSREDVPIELAVISSHEQTPDELLRRGVRCTAQAEAMRQCRGYLEDRFPFMKLRSDGPESTRGVQDVITRGNRNFLAIGPSHAAEPMGGFIVGPRQINPEGSVTSFYILQRDPREDLLPRNPRKTQQVTALAIAYPEGEGELTKCLEIAENVGIEAIRYMPYNPKDPTKHNPNLKRDGGILEVTGGYFDQHVTEFCAKVNQLRAIDGVDGPFDSKRLGEYCWYPEETIDLHQLAA